MNVLVIGCGLLGRKIARTMDEMGWDVSVLSNIESDLELLENDFEGVTFRGFPMDIRNLREAGIESCDAVAVTTADDNLNITVAQIARDYFGIQNVVARVSDPARELIFEHMGLHTMPHKPRRRPHCADAERRKNEQENRVRSAYGRL